MENVEVASTRRVIYARHGGSLGECWTEFASATIPRYVASLIHEGDWDGSPVHQVASSSRINGKLQNLMASLYFGPFRLHIEQDFAVFTYWPASIETTKSSTIEVGMMSITSQRELTQGMEIQPAILIVAPGGFEDIDTLGIPTMRVIVGVIEDQLSRGTTATGTLQLLDLRSVRNRSTLILQPSRLHAPSSFALLPWPCTAARIYQVPLVSLLYSCSVSVSR